jgi:hypothetical protein
MSDDKDQYITPERTDYTGYNSSNSSLCSDPSRNYSMELDVCCSGKEKCTRPHDKAGLIRCDKCAGWYHEGVCGDAYPVICPITMKERFVYMCELCAELIKTKDNDGLNKNKTTLCGCKRGASIEEQLMKGKKKLIQK